jgi:EmrB/QacA subfamily drug resistance transporter
MKIIQTPTLFRSARHKLRQPWSDFEARLALHDNQVILISLMAPFVMLVFNEVVFQLTLPTMRDVFQIRADVVAWIMTAYTLPFMISMPLYGRLGDELGKRRLFVAGIITFLAGTLITVSATSLPWFMVGRIIQGLGSAGVVPLSMAIIAQRFPIQERGKALGTWNSIGPVTNITAPLVVGLLVDYLNWRLAFGPVLLVGLGAAWIIWKRVPAAPRKVDPVGLARFDWPGVLLLTLTLTTFMFYLSSQQITGVAPLQDWRLLALSLLLFTIFFTWEKRQISPYIDLKLFTNKTFSRASICAGLRMFAMSGISFIAPLYLADIHQLNASVTGFILVAHAGALLFTMRLGGQLADSWRSRRPVTAGMAIQTGAIASLAVLPATAPLWAVALGLAIHGLSAGLSLAALHRASLGKVPPEKTGIAAGLYGLVRFAGTMLGPALGGILLQWGLDQGFLPVLAYQLVFWLMAGVVFLGVVIGSGLEE